MIEFKIISSPDRSQQATYQHTGSSLTLGQSEGDMIIDDPAIAPLQLRIYWEGTSFVLENLAEEIEVRLNGRPFQGPVPLKEKDNLIMGRTTLNFSRLDLKPLTPPEPFQYPHASTRFVEGSREKTLLDVLEHLENAELPSAPTVAPPPRPPGVKPPLPPGAPPPLPRKT